MTHNVKQATDVDRRIGEKIEQLRTSLGITRQDLAEKLGITHQQLQKYEKGTNRITVSRLLDIADIMGVSAIYFFEDVLHTMDTESTEMNRQCLGTMRDFLRIDLHQREALRQLIKTLADAKS